MLLNMLDLSSLNEGDVLPEIRISVEQRIRLDLRVVQKTGNNVLVDVLYENGEVKQSGLNLIVNVAPVDPMSLVDLNPITYPNNAYLTTEDGFILTTEDNNSLTP